MRIIIIIIKDHDSDSNECCENNPHDIKDDDSRYHQEGIIKFIYSLH